jgi:hypothetical protein
MVLVAALTHDRAPVWLQEGFAKVLEHRWRMAAGLSLNPSMQHFLAKALASGKLITFDAMCPSMAKTRRPHLKLMRMKREPHSEASRRGSIPFHKKNEEEHP